MSFYYMSAEYVADREYKLLQWRKSFDIPPAMPIPRRVNWNAVKLTGYSGGYRLAMEQSAHYANAKARKRRKKMEALRIETEAEFPTEPRTPDNTNAELLPALTGDAEIAMVTNVIQRKLASFAAGGYRQKIGEKRQWQSGGASMSPELRDDGTQLAWLSYWRRRGEIRNRVDQIKLARRCAANAMRTIGRTDRRMQATIASAASMSAMSRRETPQALDDAGRKELTRILVKLAKHKRQGMIILCIAVGMKAPEIATELQIKRSTLFAELSDYRREALRKLGLDWRAAKRHHERHRFTTMELAKALENPKE